MLRTYLQSEWPNKKTIELHAYIHNQKIIGRVPALSGNRVVSSPIRDLSMLVRQIETQRISSGMSANPLDSKLLSKSEILSINKAYRVVELVNIRSTMDFDAGSRGYAADKSRLARNEKSADNNRINGVSVTSGGFNGP